ncbi:MAG: sialate O-acetylesterase [Verrucomicrobiae bacterium]|nr:sialate O-acetylesterase [Verrucomicrobiae bacterium]NNJ43586.1 sialate O-acetylesterase [Akkermansiaceae bacterium]
MKHLILSLFGIIFLVVFASAEEKYQGSKSDLHVYLLIGQSNMAGRAAYDEADAGPIDRCYLLNGEDTWELSKNPLNRYSTIRKGLGMQKMNPGYGFVHTMLKKQSGVSIGLVVNAKGGTKIEQWGPGTKFYKEAIRRAKAAQKSGTLKGVLWHQGESNHGNADGYLEKLSALVNALRKDLGCPELPFIAGQVIKSPTINQQIAQLPEKVDRTAFVSSAGLKGKDRWHFDTPSMKELGKRYAEAMLKLNKSF